VSTEAKTSYITAEMQNAVGGEIDRRVSYPVSASDIRRWAMATYYPEEPPRQYWDEEYAKTTVHQGIVAPPEMNVFAWMAAEPRGVPKRAGINPDRIENALGAEGPAAKFGAKFMLNGGVEVRHGVRLRPGDVITSVVRLAGYSEREGKLGLMLMTFSEDTWTNQRGEMVKVQRDTLIRYAGRPS
jgi:hypothetical protein